MDELMLAKEVGQIVTMSFTLTQACKMAGMNSKYAPLVSIIGGVALSFALGINPVFGLMGGFSASGIYSGLKKTSEKEEKWLEPEK